MEEFFPETYRLDIRDEREAFFTLFDGERRLDARPALGRWVQERTKDLAPLGQGQDLRGRGRGVFMEEKGEPGRRGPG